MLGRQFNLYLGPEDQAPFEEALRSAGNFAVLRSRSRSCIPEELNTTVLTRFGEEPLRVLLALKSDVEAIAFRPVKGRDEYSGNPTTEPFVEFDRSYVSTGIIRPGRLFYVPRYPRDDGQVIVKPTAFTEWAKRLFQVAKASLIKIGPNYYAGAEALKLRSAGTALEGTT